MNFESLTFKGYRAERIYLGQQELLDEIRGFMRREYEFWVLYVPEGKEKPCATPSSLIKDPENFVEILFKNLQWEAEPGGIVRPLTAIYVKI